jgi:hypothetical protein
MTDASRQWQDIKTNYLKQIEKCLGDIDHPQREDILANVAEHLDNKYNELPPENRNWENFQQIITEMGPPQEYAELLTEEKTPAAKHASGINTFLAIVFVIVLMVVGGYLIYNAKKTPAPAPPVVPAPPSIPTAKAFEFELDERVLGKWATVDFVKTIDDYDPGRKNWPGELFLLSLEFQDDGKVQWRAGNKKPIMLNWTKGKVEPLEKRPSFYYLRNIDGQTYLFYEWVSGDVTERGREPAYYVLKQVKDGETIIPDWFENDPDVLGKWVTVDFVERIDQFRPDRKVWSGSLFFRSLEFHNNGQVRWQAEGNKILMLDWTKGKVEPFDERPSFYSLKNIDGQLFMFYEWISGDVTIRGQRPAYYVLKKAE